MIKLIESISPNGLKQDILNAIKKLTFENLKNLPTLELKFRFGDMGDEFEYFEEYSKSVHDSIHYTIIDDFYQFVDEEIDKADIDDVISGLEDGIISLSEAVKGLFEIYLLSDAFENYQEVVMNEYFEDEAREEYMGQELMADYRMRPFDYD